MSEQELNREVKLSELKKGDKGRINRVEPHSSSHSSQWIARLLTLGFLEGSLVEVIHEAPFGGDPLAVRIRGALVALRRNEANAIHVILCEGGEL